MILYYNELEALSSQQEEKITEDERKCIQKKNGDKALKIFFPVFSVILLIASVCSFIFDQEFPLFYILVLVFLGLPMSVDSLNRKEICACYGTVTKKTVRCAKVSGRGSVYLPYEKTAEIGTFKHKFTLSETVYEFFYCDIEINGQVYEHVCCKSKDFPDIEIGERIIVANEDGYRCPVIYKGIAKE